MGNGRAGGGVGPGPAGDLAPLLGPWEDKRLRRRAAATAGELGFRFCDAPPHRVRDAFGVLGATAPDEGAPRSPHGPPPGTALVDLAASHWGRIGGEVGYAPDRVRVDRITTPTAKAPALDRCIREAWPDAVRLALVSTWASWMAPEPLEETSGDRFDHLDLDAASVVTWRWE